MKNDLSSDFSTRERELFLDALEKRDEKARAAFLDRMCGADSGLRERVEALLREHEESAGFLEAPAAGAGPGEDPGASTVLMKTAVITASERPGDRIAHYNLLQKIGEGGCGIVYMAEQEEPVRRRVALKIIKLGMDTKNVIARFEAERQAVALMDHPNIAKVLDAGATQTGRPYFVMELVRGIRITDYCDQNNVSTEERLGLFIQVCQAIQHAHQKGIIHRDIKPSNILVTLHDGTAVPKVIDFGIAKATEQRLTDKTLFTEFQAFIGTPAYMSPEQAEMSGLDIDTRSDIYSLGVLLYELLTGKTPFDAAALVESGLDACRRTIREQEPVRPSTRVAGMAVAELTTTAERRQTEGGKLVHALRGDLDWIVMKCLEKDRTRRYETANGLMLDIQRYLNDEPILARPPSSWYRVQKMIRRHRGPVAAAAAVTMAVLAGASISIWQAIRATHAEHDAETSQQEEAKLRHIAEAERENAEKEKRAARVNEYIADINLAQESLKDGNFGRAVQLLNKHRSKLGEPDLRGFEWHYLWEVSQGDKHTNFPRQEGGVHALAFSRDGEKLAIAVGGKVNVWNFRAKSPVTTLGAELGAQGLGRRGGTNRMEGFAPPGMVSVEFLADGSGLASSIPGGGSRERRPFGNPFGNLNPVRVWRTADWGVERWLTNSVGPVTMSRDGSRLAVSKGRSMRAGGAGIWDTATWREVEVIAGASAPMALSAEGRLLAADAEAGITVWPLGGRQGGPIVLQDSTNVFIRRGPGSRLDRVLTFSPDGESVIAARNTLSERGVFVLDVWDARTGKETAVIPNDPEHIEHTGTITSMEFSPDGRILATASVDHSIRIWAWPSKQLITALQGNMSEVWALAFSPDGQDLVSGAKDGQVKIWDKSLWTGGAPQRQESLEVAWMPLAFSKDSRTLAALTRSNSVVFLNIENLEMEEEFPLQPLRSPFPSAVAISHDLQTMAQSIEDGRVKVWDLRTHGARTVKAPGRHAAVVSLSPGGRFLIAGEPGPGLHWWDFERGTDGAWPSEAQRLLFSPDGLTVAGFLRDRSTIELWDVASRTLRTNLVTEAGSGPPGGVGAFSADGRMLAVAGNEDTIRLWDVPSGKWIGTFTGHKQGIWSVAFSPDGKTLVTASEDSTLRMWNVATQQELLAIRRLGGNLGALVFSPDGQVLVGASGPFTQSPSLRVYRAPVMNSTEAGQGMER